MSRAWPHDKTHTSSTYTSSKRILGPNEIKLTHGLLKHSFMSRVVGSTQKIQMHTHTHTLTIRQEQQPNLRHAHSTSAERAVLESFHDFIQPNEHAFSSTIS